MRASHQIPFVVRRTAIAALIVLGGLLPAQEISLSGQVVDQKGAPVDGVLVRLLGADLTTLTGSDGRWTFEEATPKALFPRRLQSANTITWGGPGEPVQVEMSTLTGVAVLMFDAKGQQIAHQHQNCPKGATAINLQKVPAEAVLVSIASQACDRVAYRLAPGPDPRKAVLTFSTCPGAAATATDGMLDMVSVEHPRYQPVRAPLASLVKADPALAKMTLVPLTGTEFHVDPIKGTEAGTGTAASPSKSIAAIWGKLTGGETVVLHDGNYGTFDLGGESGFSWWVTFAAAPGAKPTFERITSDAGKSSIWDGEFDLRIRLEGLTITDGISLRGTRWVEINNCTITSAGEISGSMENIQKSGVGFRNARGIRIEGCDISHTGNGINGVGNHVIYRRNHIHHVSQDGFHWLGGHDFLAEYNDIHDMDDGTDDAERKPWNMHDDCIQMYPWFGNDEPANWLADVTMRGNRLYRPELMAWMLQSKNQKQFKRWLIENNITSAVPGYMFHFKDSCDGLVFRFNSFLLPDAGYQFKGFTGRSFDTLPGLNWVALPGNGPESRDIECYGNIMGRAIDFDGPALTRCDNNLYYSADGTLDMTRVNAARRETSSLYLGPPGNPKAKLGHGERILTKQPFLDPMKIDGVLAPDCPAIKAGMVLPEPQTPRMQVPLPAYDATGKPRNPGKITLGAVEAN